MTEMMSIEERMRANRIEMTSVSLLGYSDIDLNGKEKWKHTVFLVFYRQEDSTPPNGTWSTEISYGGERTEAPEDIALTAFQGNLDNLRDHEMFSTWEEYASEYSPELEDSISARDSYYDARKQAYEFRDFLNVAYLDGGSLIDAWLYETEGP
jgi:hypothetical protein